MNEKETTEGNGRDPEETSPKQGEVLQDDLWYFGFDLSPNPKGPKGRLLHLPTKADADEEKEVT